jgi:hypothetical protein
MEHYKWVSFILRRCVNILKIIFTSQMEGVKNKRMASLSLRTGHFARLTYLLFFSSVFLENNIHTYIHTIPLTLYT